MYASQFPCASGGNQVSMMRISERPGSVRRSTSNRDRNFRARAKLVHVKTSGPRTNTTKKNYNVSVLIITWYDTTTD